mgnify:CR=1 FL=1
MYRRYVFALALFLLFGCDASRRDAPPVAAAPLVTIPTNAPASEPEPAQTPTPHVTSTPDATATTGPTVERPVQTMPMLRTGNVRANAGTDYDILHQLEEGTLVRLQKTRIAPDGSRWFFVSSGFLGKQRSGWISESLVAPTELTISSLPVAAPLPPRGARAPSAAPRTPSSGGRTGAVCRDGSRSSATGSGACSRHGGVDHWLYGP